MFTKRRRNKRYDNMGLLRNTTININITIRSTRIECIRYGVSKSNIFVYRKDMCLHFSIKRYLGS